MPLHHQIKVALLHGIEEGWLEPGRQLPRERELAEFLGVSLAPVRQAMADLNKEGYLDRARGRGTFVRARKVDEKIAILGSFHEALRRQGIEPSMGVLDDEIGEAPKHVAGALGLRGGKVWKLRRQALIDGQPVALLTAWLPARYASSLRAGRNFAKESLYAALAEVHGVVMSQADNLIEVDRAGLDEATQMRLPPGAPLLKVIGVTRDQNDRRVEYSEVLYDADRFRFSIESRRMANGVTYLADRSP
jgi:GntR family transcriptional regulator